jgi:hypothetical protein
LCLYFVSFHPVVSGSHRLGNVIATRADYQHNRNYDDFDTFADEMTTAAKTALAATK